MPLPAYLTQQPTIDPIDLLSRRVARIAENADIGRVGQTITSRALDCCDVQSYRRAIRLMCEQADTLRYSIEAHVPNVLGDSVGIYEESGFSIAYEAGSEDMDGAHYLLRRRAVR